MNNYIKHSILNFNDYPNRVCLPYGSNFFDISRWLLKENSLDYEIFSGSTCFEFKSIDTIEIYSLIIEKCIGYILESSFIRNKKSGNLIYFDIYERFSFFAGDLDIAKQLFPFDREIIWENYHLYQDDDGDGDDFKQDVFNTINTIPN